MRGIRPTKPMIKSILHATEQKNANEHRSVLGSMQSSEALGEYLPLR